MRPARDSAIPNPKESEVLEPNVEPRRPACADQQAHQVIRRLRRYFAARPERKIEMLSAGVRRDRHVEQPRQVHGSPQPRKAGWPDESLLRGPVYVLWIKPPACDKRADGLAVAVVMAVADQVGHGAE